MTRPYDQPSFADSRFRTLKIRLLLFFPIIFATLFVIGVWNRYVAPDRAIDNSAYVSSATATREK
ncbi:hypothetical protein [Asticcacaulis sp. YBE204]|uniref:hypothetical protein n=1 Tax=Asticcacaulis sp. YBE204 TaxID=1282363 RepID=UPI0003C3B161|nr:hypothetical protein [Asticcacaulis sp. YBE204]ESQ76895.1 hypothetical protein AEYBE204_18640 [Asticcacaulis sp. YBE204]